MKTQPGEISGKRFSVPKDQYMFNVIGKEPEKA